MRNKDNDFLPRYYTNKAIKSKIDKALQEINESIMPNLTALDCSESEKKQYKLRVIALENIIKTLDPEYYESTYLLDV